MNEYIRFMHSEIAGGKCDRIDLVILNDVQCFVHSIHISVVLSLYIFIKKNLRHHCHSDVLQLNYLYSSNIEKKKEKEN